MIRYAIVLFFSLTVLFAQKPPEKISLQLQWMDQFQFAGYYIAKEKGFYAEAGLDVTFQKFEATKIPVNEVVSGRAQYGIGRSTLLIDRMEGKPVVALAAILQSSPFVLLTAESSGIRTPNDLVGKRIMMTSDFQDSVAMRAMFSSQGIDMERVSVIDHSFNPLDIANGKADAMACYLSNEPFVLQEQGIDTYAINPEQYGFDFYSDILFTTEEEILAHPDRVRAFLDATLRGWEYAFDHIEETAHLIKERYNDQNKSYHSLVYEGKVLKELAYREDRPLGSLSLEKFGRISDVYKVLGIPQDEERLKGIVYEETRMASIPLSPGERHFVQTVTIRYTSTDRWPPFNFPSEKDPNGLQGIAVDFWKLIVEKTGMQTAYKPASTWRGVLEAIKTKTSDVTLGTPISLEEPYALFSKPYASFPAVIVTNKTIDFLSGLSALKGKRVAIKEQYGLGDTIRRDYPTIRIVDVTRASEGLKLLSAGEVDAVIDLLPVVAFLINEERYVDLQIAGTTGFNADVRFMIRNDYPQLKSIIDKAIDSISPAERQAIFNRYIAVTYAKGINYRYITAGTLVALVVIALLFYRDRLMSRYNEQLLHMASTDPLTQIPNRIKTDERLKECHAHFQRTRRPYSVIIVDIDRFKQVNDLYGHLSGDRILIQMAQILRDNIRATDMVGRWGGEEFIIICPETDTEGVQRLAEKIHAIVNLFDFEDVHTLSCSMGIAECREGDRPEHVVGRADDALYCAKAEGRNRIRIDGEKLCVNYLIGRRDHRSCD